MDLMKEALRKALLFLDFKGKTIVLNGEQEKALYSLLEAKRKGHFGDRFWKINDFYDVFCCCSRTNTGGSFSVGNIAAQQHNRRPNRIVMCSILKSRGLFPPLMPCLLQNLFHFRLYAPLSDDGIIKFT